MTDQQNMTDQQEFIDLWKSRCGYYNCPVNQAGERDGTVVAYAGKYDIVPGGEQTNYVGFEYWDFAMVERDPEAVLRFAKQLHHNILESPAFSGVNTVVGAPLGGMVLATVLSQVSGWKLLYAEKKIDKLADPEKGQREESHLIWNRHKPEASDRIAIVEDVFNNFSTTDKMIALIEGAGAKVAGLVGALDRSDRSGYKGLPMAQVIDKPTEQFRQDDPAVASLIEAGRLSLNPKGDWDDLMALMVAAV